MNALQKDLRSLVAAALGVFLLSQAGSAAPPNAGERLTGAPAAERVDVRGLDLSTANGRERLARQIAAAANAVCRTDDRVYRGVARLKHEDEQVRPCIDAAVRGALAQVAAATGQAPESFAGLVRFEGTGR